VPLTTLGEETDPIDRLMIRTKLFQQSQRSKCCNACYVSWFWDV